MSLVDSKAAFQQRCDEIDPSKELGIILAGAGVESFSQMSFSVGSPQSPVSDPEFVQFAQKICGHDVTMGMQANLKRLHFEATTLVIAELKMKVSSGPTDSAKLPLAEKAARLRSQRDRLTGVLIQGELEPSHQLIDKASGMVESGLVLWISPDRCSKREDEIVQLQKPSKQSVSIEHSALKVGVDEPELKADLSNDLRLQWALQRRGVAFDQCHLLSWKTHEAWVQQLMQSRVRPPPAGYGQVTTHQLIRADQELWLAIADLQLDTLKPDPNGEEPLEEPVKRLRYDPRVTMHLLPFAADRPSQGKAPVQRSGQAASAEKPRANKKAKARPRDRTRLPEALKDFKLRTDDGEPICYGFNLQTGCGQATHGNPKKCCRGLHICAKCHKPGHSVLTCRTN